MIIEKEYFTNQSPTLHLFVKNTTVDDLYVPVYFPFVSQFNSDHVYSFEDIAESINYYAKPHSNIVFDSYVEGLSVEYIKAMDPVVKLLINKYKFPIKQLRYFSGALPIRANINAYKDYCFRNKCRPINLTLTNNLELHAQQNAINSIDFHNYSLGLKTKKFVSMNGVARLFRIYVAMLLFEKNLINKSYYSLHLDSTYNFEDICYKGSKWFSTINDRIEKEVLLHKDKFPMTLTIDNNIDPQDRIHYHKNDLELFSNVYFNFIQETNFTDSEDGNEGFNVKNTVFITEKTFRSFIYSTPFVMANMPKCLEGLRDYGYKTFSPYFDESYDLIKDDTKRLLKIVDEVERLCNLSDNEWLTIQRDLEPIIQYNQNKLKAAKPYYIEYNV